MRKIINYKNNLRLRAPTPALAASGHAPQGCSRRRALALIAAGSAALLAGSPPLGAAAIARRTWRGTVFGAPATITLVHPDGAAVDAALGAVQAEIAALESVFSLYRSDSALTRLNTAGRLDDAPAALRELLGISRDLFHASAGAFDPSVQSLWTLYATHFAAPDAAPEGPSAASLAAAGARVDFARVQWQGRAVTLGTPGMQLTFNGIAQGYATERARGVLARHGLTHALVNLGEYHALGTRGDGRAWRLAIAHPEVPWRTLGEIELPPGRALATSAAMGTSFDAGGRFHHLFDAKRARPAIGWRSVSVVAGEATLADGLSTTLAVAPPHAAAAILAHYPGCGALLLGADGEVRRLGDGVAAA